MQLVASIRKKIDDYELDTAIGFAWSDDSFGEWQIRQKQREEWNRLHDHERETIGKVRIYEDDGKLHIRPTLGGPKK